MTSDPRRVSLILLGAWLLLLAACGGGGGSSSPPPPPPPPPPPTNMAPSADAGVDQSALENSVFQLTGAGTDPDAGDTLSFQWIQLSGTSVTIDTPTAAQASFTAPDVPLNTPEVLTFRLSVTDAGGLSATDDMDVTVFEAAVQVTISGTLRFEFPRPNASCRGLDFSAVDERPIRQATVELLDAASNAVLATTLSDDNGEYAFVTAGLDNVFVRVRAELKKTGSPSWDVEVRDNTAQTGGVPALALRPMYVLDGPAALAGSPSGASQVRDMLARHGWTGNGFTGLRSAAPFAVLDTIYSGIQLILTADPTVNFAPLDAFWSVNNTPTSMGTNININIGELGTSFYRSDINSLFLLGKDGVDTEEFDDHVIAHEWGHYFEDNFSRSDSIGGPHSLNDRLDARLAFGEGFANALSGMVLDNPMYCDTLWSGGRLSGFEIPLENEVTGSFAGWYNESSVMKILYDLWDTDIDGADTSSIGFAAIYNVFIGAQANTDAFTSIFSFIEALKAAGTGQNPFIDGLLEDESIVAAGIDRWGTNQTNDAGSVDVLPVYTTIVPDGTPVTVCSISQFDTDRDGNKLSEHRYLLLDVNPASQLTFTMDSVDPPSLPSAGFDCTVGPDNPEQHEHSDPDIEIYKNGNFVWGGFSCEPNREVTTSPVLSGRYVLDVVEFRYLDEESVLGFPEKICFDISISP